MQVRALLRKILLHPTWSLAAAIAVALVGSIMAIRATLSLQHDLQRLYTRDLIGQNDVQSVRIKLMMLERKTLGLLLLTNHADVARSVDQVRKDRDDAKLYLAASKRFYRTKRGQSLIKRTEAVLAACDSAEEAIVAVVKSGRRGDAVPIASGALRARLQKADCFLDTLDDIKQNHDLRVFKSIDYQLSISTAATALVLVLTVGMRVLLYWRARRRGKRAAD